MRTYFRTGGGVLNLEQFLGRLREDPALRERIQAWRVDPPTPAVYGEWPEQLDEQLIQTLRNAGISRPYSHQEEAIRLALEGRHTLIDTPTASGKSLCFHVPVLDAICKRPSSRSLYLYPTKALAQDQQAGLAEISAMLPGSPGIFTYDGDTSPQLRQAARTAGRVIMTNPDMLHAGLLPHHTKWVGLFENLRYVVIDEIHAYRGVFGSHLANVIRRLRRIASFYGSRPVFILCSATIAHAKEFAETLIGAPVEQVSRSGAPKGEQHFLVIDPPLVDPQRGIRRSVLLEARDVVSRLVRNHIQTLIFARSRLSVEVLLEYLRQTLGDAVGPERIQAYRGGYLPQERRRIERDLREGRLLGVVATNALELGIDIGTLQATVLAGYPGSISATRQQAGRAGRRGGASLVIFIPSAHPLDRYIAQHPDFLFANAPEEVRIHPDNLLILFDHLKCAAFELPFTSGERFGQEPVDELLAYLEEERIVRRVQDRWFWMADHFPAHDVNLRSASQENVVIIHQEAGKAQVIGEIDRFSAPLFVHDEAIYLHGGRQYQVERFDFEANKAYVKPVQVNYYTDAQLAVTIQVLDVFREQPSVAGDTPGRSWAHFGRAYGEVLLTALPTLFKKIRFETRENVGWGKIHLPEQQMHTTAYWLTLAESAVAHLAPEELQAGLAGLSHLVGNLAPLFVMCDARDLRSTLQVRSPFTGLPTLYLYDAVPGGIGFSERLYQLHQELLSGAEQVLMNCDCVQGCPICVGPDANVAAPGVHRKNAVLKILRGEPDHGTA